MQAISPFFLHDRPIIEARSDDGGARRPFDSSAGLPQQRSSQDQGGANGAGSASKRPRSPSPSEVSGPPTCPRSPRSRSTWRPKRSPIWSCGSTQTAPGTFPTSKRSTLRSAARRAKKGSRSAIWRLSNSPMAGPLPSQAKSAARSRPTRSQRSKNFSQQPTNSLPAIPRQPAPGLCLGGIQTGSLRLFDERWQRHHGSMRRVAQHRIQQLGEGPASRQL